ncbi:TetR/AcrR family transcriptional regulator [Oerskovia flava]|uniref:TetR/AcrR family transcriptional regulator n=1 Tax=Oerskovia flava TaxID=2986422 RepID=UPI00223EAAFE|nr:TetR/AcrR family transcriptional regulator [Oerskovia sp. JB1-3-2]
MARDTRERIVRVARELVHGSSFAQVSVEDVCQAAGVHKGSFYHFFGSKDALGLTLLDTNWLLVRAMLDEAFDAPAPPLQRIDAFVQGFCGMLVLVAERTGTMPGCPVGPLAAELAPHGDDARTRAAEVLDAWSGYFADAVREGQARGDLARGLDPAEVGRQVLGYLQGMALLAQVDGGAGLADRSRSGVRALLGAPG